MSDVAVVVLNLNGRRFLDACLGSLECLTVPADVVMVDNGSTDDSVSHVLAHFPDVRVLDMHRNLGFAEGYNRALGLVEAQWVALVNPDATLEPQWLEVLLADAEWHPEATIFGGKLLFAGCGHDRVIESAGASFTEAGAGFEIGWGEPDVGQYDHAKVVGAIPGAALLIRRDAFFALGGFDPAYFAYLEDVDLCWRAWLAGQEVHYVPGAVAWHHYGQAGGGRASPFRIRLVERNRLANMVKHLETRSLARALPVSTAYDAYRLAEFVARRDGAAAQALVAGMAAFWRDRRDVRAQRMRLQRGRLLSDQELRERGLLVSAADAMREYRRLSRVRLPQQGKRTPARSSERRPDVLRR